MNAPDAVVRLLKARYCVQLEAGKRVPTTSRMPVQRQVPVAGSTGGTWSTVTLTVGVPRRPGTPKNAKMYMGVDTYGGGRTPCPPIRTTG